MNSNLFSMNFDFNSIAFIAKSIGSIRRCCICSIARCGWNAGEKWWMRCIGKCESRQWNIFASFGYSHREKCRSRRNARLNQHIVLRTRMAVQSETHAIDRNRIADERGQIQWILESTLENGKQKMNRKKKTIRKYTRRKLPENISFIFSLPVFVYVTLSRLICNDISSF